MVFATLLMNTNITTFAHSQNREMVKEKMNYDKNESSTKLVINGELIKTSCGGTNSFITV